MILMVKRHLRVLDGHNFV